MEIRPIGTASLNGLIASNSESSSAQSNTTSVQFNSANVEPNISPQGRVLQQLDAQASQRREEFDASRQPSEAEPEQTREPNRSFIRVSSDQGSTSQRNNLSAEQAAEVYRSIQGLL